ncbi:outer membrane protein [Roseovarius sp. A-2]|uniref:OmpH family outer membrane protein n=1 Tax=Roseovarius sp. A-2 TaxID=1570360 RepID=UPI0009B52051|nr:OmpH family outer membrane protein [Roseovarius sp. A-2]GAW35620.1 outer membrane protein [Roseovarius sp. A-2]
MRRAFALIGLLALALGSPDAAPAQQLGVVNSDVVVIDSERLLTETEYGQRLQREVQEERERLIAHNERVAAQLEEEEQSLTEMRGTVPAEEFRDMADAFDAKVTELRRESETKSRELERRRELAPLQFMRVVQPVLADLLNEADAVAMLDRRGVLLHADVADVTDLAISRIDAQIGAGPDALPQPQEDAGDARPMPELPVPDGN